MVLFDKYKALAAIILGLYLIILYSINANSRKYLANINTFSSDCPKKAYLSRKRKELIYVRLKSHDSKILLSN